MVTVTDDERQRGKSCHPSTMVALLGRTRIAIFGIIVIVLVNIGMEYSSMVAVEPDAVVQTTPTTITTIKGGDGADKNIIVDDGTDKKFSKIVAQEMGEKEDDNELILRGENRTIQMISDNIQSWASSSSTFKQDATLLEKDKNISLPLPACLKARSNTIPRSMYGKLSFPVINLGFPKIGSTSIHKFFGNAGYSSNHLVCQRKDRSGAGQCAQCIADSIEMGLSPLKLCRNVDVYSQIDGNMNETLYFPQIDLLEEIVKGLPNATFLLTFRSMEGWYQSVSRWGTLHSRMMKLNLTIGDTTLGGGSQQEFASFFCEHVQRVRELVPANRLVEIDIEDTTIGARMSDIFDVDEESWERTNVNGKIHPEADKNETVFGSLLPGWNLVGKEMIRGKNGTMRLRSRDTYSEAFNEDLQDCLRARQDTIPRSMYGKLSFPVINLGFPKIGSTSIHNFFGNAGYASLHYRCLNDTSCAECVSQSIEQGLSPMQLCLSADVYSQIDGRANERMYFPQVDLLEEIVNGLPNATFLLTFRSMDGWYNSVSGWGTLWKRMMNANLTIGETTLGGGSQKEFTNFFCEHIHRVRELVPSKRLVEIDMEDPTIGARMSEIFDIDEECWGRTNANSKLHPDIDKNQTFSSSTPPVWNILGKEVIRGKNGTMRMRLSDAPSSSTTVELSSSPEDNYLSPECLRARNDTVPKSMHGNLTFPVINLGFPEMGSSSIHTFFGCAGFESFHWSAQCEMCPQADVYQQIDGEIGGRFKFPQMNSLEELVDEYPDATYVLPFWNVDARIQSLLNWGVPRKKDLIRSDNSLKDGSLLDLFCEHVRHVREIVPPNRLVEIDIEDAGSRMSDIFDLDEECWGRTNVNSKLHPGINTTEWETQLSRWHMNGEEIGNTPTSSNFDPYEVDENEDGLPDCLRARNETIPPSMYGNLSFPVINLGFPKMGSTSIHAFFGSAGYESTHWLCPEDSNEIRITKCAQCIDQSVQSGVLPLELCPRADVYSQIDGGINGIYHFPQIDLLENLVSGYPNATFLLTFRSMEGWYQSISNWPAHHNIAFLKDRLFVTNSIARKHLGVGSLQNFTDFFCKHVRRVRRIVPANRLVEIDIEDPTTGMRMAEIFDIDKKLWGRKNVNYKLHPESKKKKRTKTTKRRKKKTKEN